MTVNLSAEEIELLLASLEHGKEHVRKASEMLHSVRHDNLEKLDALTVKLQEAKEEKK